MLRGAAAFGLGILLSLALVVVGETLRDLGAFGMTLPGLIARLAAG